MRNLKTILIAIVSVAVVGFSINAFAQGGRGWGHHGGWYDQDNYGPGYAGQMTQEEYEQFQQQREAFFKETEGLRSDLFEKRRALQSELAKETPDTAKAAKIQKEISELQAKFDQKRVDHMIKMKKLNPKFAWGGKGRGPMGGGPMMGQGYGPRGGGYCWR